MILNFVYVNAPYDLLRYSECNQISISGNGTPVHEIDAKIEKKNHGITSTMYSLLSQWRWRVGASAWEILENIILVVLVHYLETAISIKTLSSLYSSLSSSLSLINSISKPTTDNLHFPSLLILHFICHHVITSLSFIHFHSTVDSFVLITHAQIRSGCVKSYSRTFTRRICLMFQW